MATPVQEAQRLDAWGFNVLPAKPGGNHPQVEWKEYQERRTTEKLNSWFAGLRPRDYWIVTGLISHVVVLDCDNAEAEAYWREKLGDAVLDATPAVRTKRGIHFYFRLDEPMASWSVHPDKDAGETGPSFDVRADKTGVVAPPSQNKTWIRDPDSFSMEPVPEALRKPGADQAGAIGGDGPRSMLTHLLKNPGEGGYNNWFTRVCGHYAKEYKNRRDAYEYHCWEAYAKLDTISGGDPHPRKDAEKTLEQIWASEWQKGEDAARPEAYSGWLLPGDHCIMTQTITVEETGKGADKEKVAKYGLEEWADFNLVALGVVEDDESARVYDVEVHRSRRQDITRRMLPAKVLADPKQLTAWCFELGVTIAPPINAWPKEMPSHVKLLRYLEAQNPPHFRVVEHLGWHEDGFVVHEGVITAEGLRPHDKFKPHPKLLNWAPYRYGFRYTELETAEILREILTFHDETVTSVFGSWWAASLLKPQIHKVSSQFPFMALEATSESGKTTGFFSMLLEMAGNTQGNVSPTKAALRDFASAHQSGVVWVDDLDTVDHLMETLRQATGEGSVTKKGEDRTKQETAHLVAPISISGENLNLRDQKALVDRAVLINVPNPTQRRSLRNPENLQWLDILEVKRLHPDLTEFAGTLVQMALKHADMVEMLPSLVPQVGGRFGDKVAILRFGAHLLAAITGDERHIDRVDAWVSELNDTGSENSLTLKVLPQALAQLNWPKHATSGHDRWPTTPAFVLEERVWFSPQHLAQWWESYRNGRVESRTESRDALEQQAKALGLGGKEGRKRFNVDHDANKKTVYWDLGAEMSKLVLARSRGEEAVRKGVHPELQRLSFRAYTSQAEAELDDDV